MTRKDRPLAQIRAEHEALRNDGWVPLMIGEMQAQFEQVSEADKRLFYLPVRVERLAQAIGAMSSRPVWVRAEHADLIVAMSRRVKCGALSESAALRLADKCRRTLGMIPTALLVLELTHRERIAFLESAAPVESIRRSGTGGWSFNGTRRCTCGMLEGPMDEAVMDLLNTWR